MAKYLTEQLVRIGINYTSLCCRTVAFAELSAGGRVGSWSSGVLCPKAFRGKSYPSTGVGRSMPALNILRMDKISAS
ncbi:MAG: hypothetical protein GX439_08865 [Bacteroidales bacterium]|nr:hypothetical protein [Bacteroidales bacterium]